MKKSKETKAMPAPDYEKLYHKSFNAITDAQQTVADAQQLLTQAQRLTELATKILRESQHKCEEMYMQL